MTYAVETGGEDMDEESSDELRGAQGHGFVAVFLFGPVIFVFEGDAVLVVGDESGV